jgi:hypothetical protein|tara:strand:- start:1042 stop:1182 length:141 start_codon:yes stop_codon:yes gene_type:complete
MMNKIKNYLLFWSLMSLVGMWYMDITPTEAWYLLETLPNYIKYEVL